MAKFKIGDTVKWNDGVYHHDNKRMDVITKVIADVWGDTRYYTKEVNNPEGTKSKIGLAYENYLVSAK